MVQHVEKTQSERVQHVHRQEIEKEEEKAIVATSDAIVHPRTVMVERLEKNRILKL